MSKAQWRAFAAVYWTLCLGFIFLLLPQIKPKEPDWLVAEKQWVEQRLRESPELRSWRP